MIAQFVRSTKIPLIPKKQVLAKSRTQQFMAVPENEILHLQTSMDTNELLAQYLAGKRNFSKLTLVEARLSNTNLVQANLSHSNLSRAWLNGANLSGVNLSKANLHGADLCYANLSNADLTGADLSCALLLRANLTGAKLDDANLQWASLTDATPIDIDLSQALIGRTMMPGGYPSDGYGRRTNRYLLPPNEQNVI